MKKHISLLFALLTAVGLFSGCGKKETPQKETFPSMPLETAPMETSLPATRPVTPTETVPGPSAKPEFTDPQETIEDGNGPIAGQNKER